MKEAFNDTEYEIHKNVEAKSREISLIIDETENLTPNVIRYILHCSL